MINFVRCTEDNYIVYVNGKRVNKEPIEKTKLFEVIGDIRSSDEEILIERVRNAETERG